MADSESASSEQQAAAPEDGDVGQMLRTARESQGLAIEEIATELRMEPRLLQALEDCRFDDLGAPVFAKGYLKQYGTRLGLDYRDLLADYYRIVGSTEVQIAPSRAIKLRDERQITVWVIAALALALLAVFLFVWWLDDPVLEIESVGDPVQGSVREETLRSTVASTGAAGRSAALTGAGRGTAVGRLSPEPPPASAATASEPATVSAAEPSAGTLSAVTAGSADPTASTAAANSESGLAAAPGTAASLAPATAVATAAAAAADAPPDGPRIDVALVFAEDCWAEITDANGEQTYYGLGQAGSRANFAAAAPVRFFLGNADGVDIQVDGRPYLIPRAARDGNLARFVVDAAD
jgi:cytoskeleton protein RodZ